VTTGGTFAQYTLTSGTNPQGMIADTDSQLWFVDFKGSIMSDVTVCGTMSNYAIFDTGANLYGIAVGSDGNIWYADQANNIIDKLIL
jgi:virginiamycin B lyase